MKQLVFATNNEHKLIEIRAILEPHNIKVLSLKDVGIDIDVVEDGSTYKENALKKFIEMVKEVGTVFHYDSRIYNASEEELKEITDGDYYEYGGHTVLIKEVELMI